MPLDEFGAMKAVDDALIDLEPETAHRVIKWAWEKFGDNTKDLVQPIQTGYIPGQGVPNHKDGEIPGIARIDSDGKFHLTIRDIKAKNTNDAAIRLAHIIIWSHKELTGETSVSSKSVVSPLLKQWRAYTGNTRNALAKHKGLLRNGDNLSLDAHSLKDAEKYAKDVLDESVVGKWKT